MCSLHVGRCCSCHSGHLHAHSSACPAALNCPACSTRPLLQAEFELPGAGDSAKFFNAAASFCRKWRRHDCSSRRPAGRSLPDGSRPTGGARGVCTGTWNVVSLGMTLWGMDKHPNQLTPSLPRCCHPCHSCNDSSLLASGGYCSVPRPRSCWWEQRASSRWRSANCWWPTPMPTRTRSERDYHSQSWPARPLWLHLATTWAAAAAIAAAHGCCRHGQLAHPCCSDAWLLAGALCTVCACGIAVCGSPRTARWPQKAPPSSPRSGGDKSTPNTAAIVTAMVGQRSCSWSQGHNRSAAVR